MKRLLIILALLVALLVCAVASTWWWLTATRSGAQWALSQAGRYVDTLEWSRLEGGLAGGLVLHDVRLRAQETQFDAQRIELSARVRLLPKPSLRVYWLRGDQMTLVLPESDDEAPSEPFAMPEDLSSPVPVRLDELRLREFRIQSGGAAEPLLLDHLELAAHMDERLVIENLQAQALGWDLHGDIDAGLQPPWQAETGLSVDGEFQEQPQRADIHVELAQEILSLQAESEGLIEVRAEGTVSDLFDQPQLMLAMTSDQLGWPEVPVTASDLVAELSGTLQNWRLAAEFNAEATLPAEEAEVNLPSRWRLNAAGDLQSLTLEQGEVEILDGTVALAGDLRWDTLSAQAEVSFEHLDFTPLTPDWPHQAPVSGRVKGRYDEEIVEIETLELSAPPAPLSITGSGRIDARDDTVTADIQWHDLTWPPVTTDDQPPLFQSSRGRLQADGQLSDWRAELEALLKAGPSPEATLEAKVSGNDSAAMIEGLNLVAGENRLHITSNAEYDIDYRLNAANLQQLWPDLSGRLELAGQFNPSGSAWSVSGQGQDLAWQNFRLASLSLESQGSLEQGNSRLDSHLRLDDLDLNPWERVERLEWVTEGRCEDHQVRLEADADSVDFRLAGSAGMDACPPDFSQWQAQWSRLELIDTVAGDWTLPAPASSRVGTDGNLSLADLCLETDQEDGGRLCLSRIALEDGRGIAEASLDSLPANLLLGLSDAGIRSSSELDGEFNAAWHGQTLETLSGHLDIGRGWLRQQGAPTGLSIAGGNVRLDDAGPNNLRADVRLDVEGDSYLQAQVQLSEIQPPEGARIGGTVEAQVPDLSAYRKFVPELDQLAGRLEAAFELSGPMRAPALDGTVQLQQGHVENTPYGLRLTDIDLQARASSDQGISFDGGFTAGGRAELSGRAAVEDGVWVASTRLRGDALELFDADWLRLTISPDFGVDFAGDHIALDGRIDIPSARLGLPPGSANRVPASNDVVVLGQGDKSGESDEPAALAIPLTGELTIGLGDDVRFDGAGARAWLTGDVQLRWPDDAPVPRGRGSIHLADGHYRAYGQNLDFTDSEVQFAGRPVDNPRLDIRAIREIFADPIVEAAGVHIRGTARAPIVELYTDPATSQEKALAYIVTGADFDHASGQGAFNIGFYLMPKLFVSYGIGLFETGNVLSASYQLSRRWGLRASSGERDTGGDFIYTLNR